VRVIADGNPRWTGAVRSSLNLFKNLTVSGLLDIKRGGENWNGTKGALYNFDTHANTENRNGEYTFGTDYMPAHPGASGAVAEPGVGRKVTIGQSWYQGDGSGFGSVSRQFVEDASYVKLREISIGYTLNSPSLTRGLGFSSIDLRLAGRNLKTWTNYTGVDPLAGHDAPSDDRYDACERRGTAMEQGECWDSSRISRDYQSTKTLPGEDSGRCCNRHCRGACGQAWVRRKNGHQFHPYRPTGRPVTELPDGEAGPPQLALDRPFDG